MKNLKNILITILIVFISTTILIKVSANEPCSQQKEKMSVVSQRLNNHEDKLEPVIKNFYNECKVFLKESKTPWNELNITTCFRKIHNDDEEQKIAPELINRLLSQPAVSKKILDKTLKLFANDPFRAEYTAIIKKLLAAGATTENIDLQLVQKGNDYACESILAIVEASEKFYKDEKLLKKYDKEADLYFLADTGNGYSLCKKAILLIIQYNPKLLNRVIGDGGTPALNYYTDSLYSNWDTEVAKLLITKENVNIQTKYGETPLYLLLRNDKTFNHPEIIRYALTLGANLDIKTQEGFTIRDMILKNPRLATALKDVVQPK